MPRKINARQVLGDLAYDVQRQLERDTDPKTICDAALKRLKQLRTDGVSYYTDWSRACDGPSKHRRKKVEEQDDFEIWKRDFLGE